MVAGGHGLNVIPFCSGFVTKIRHCGIRVHWPSHVATKVRPGPEHTCSPTPGVLRERGCSANSSPYPDTRICAAGTPLSLSSCSTCSARASEMPSASSESWCPSMQTCSAIAREGPMKQAVNP